MLITDIVCFVAGIATKAAIFVLAQLPRLDAVFLFALFACQRDRLNPCGIGSTAHLIGRERIGRAQALTQRVTAHHLSAARGIASRATGMAARGFTGGDLVGIAAYFADVYYWHVVFSLAQLYHKTRRYANGSGTTGHACGNLDRRFIGIEKDAGYFAIAQERIATAYAPLRLMQVAV